MARVRDIEIDEVPDDVKPIYRRFAEEYGPFLNQVKVFAHRPSALKHIQGLLLDLADEALLPKRYLEIALVVVSKLNECAYLRCPSRATIDRTGAGCADSRKYSRARLCWFRCRGPLGARLFGGSDRAATIHARCNVRGPEATL